MELQRIEAKEAAQHVQHLTQVVKSEMDQTKNLKIQLEDKEASIKVVFFIKKEPIVFRYITVCICRNFVEF